MLKRLFVLVLAAATIGLLPVAAVAKSGNSNHKSDVVGIDGHDIDGWGRLQRNGGAGTTTIHLKLEDLDPGTTYFAHLHVGTCDDFGPHYQDEVGGSVHPPNELHIGDFVAPGNGKANRKSTAGWVARDDARAIYLHAEASTHGMDHHMGDGDMHHGGDKVACVDFPAP